MSGDPTERDVTAVADLIRPFVPDANWQRDATSAVAARAVLTSDWYAERIAQARRDAVTDGVEIDERYCEVAASRLAQDTLFGGVA